ncbi:MULTISPECIES: GntR family transcriptional regulator [Actinomycetes]|uniref:GntR family transcriptional regulator n=1 Tax=Actinomycetes TaxID=1760 RepID=UPI0018DC24A2|nr:MULTISPECIES: GntR family transcriptional regulator [Actinomycetes]
MSTPRGTFQRIADELRAEFGAQQDDGRLPSEAELTRRFGVARGTVRKALLVLRDQGLIEAEQGAGWRRVRSADDRRPLALRMEELVRAGAVGGVFPSEAELSAQFGASRVSVRSALAQLEGRGLLESRPGRRRRIRALPNLDGSS